MITPTGMTMGGLAALTTAGQMTHAYDAPPQACAVYARVEPGRSTAVRWVGDGRAYAVDGIQLIQRSERARHRRTGAGVA
ncbi:hypothetical protein [Streptomyces sp. NRRL B-1347]|uniref:hypothetical protein n=1 Tax=Streptomyces sp. NRRL B-1347 TaxID=1476877 RepID=UPI000ADAC459|nr:hypothetical protein [Streptomyces sp. NRRL B-1347]